MGFRGDIQIAIFACALVLSACGAARTTYITLQQTAPQESGNASTPAEARLLAARAIFNARCTGCHATFGTMTDAQWVSSNLVIPADSASSFLIGKIRNSGVTGAQDMPTDGTSLTSLQIQTLRFWVDGLTP